MNPQSPDDCDFYEVAAEFIIDEGEHDIAEAPQISSGGDVTEHSDSQRLHHCPKQEDDLQVSKGPSSDIHCPKQEEYLQVSKGPSSDILTSQQQEDEHGDQKSFVKDRKETSTPSQIFLLHNNKKMSMVKDRKKTSTPSQNPQGQQQQQPPPVERLCSDHPPLEENLGKIMAEDLLEHQIVNHEGKPSEEAGPASDFHSSNDIESTEALRPLNPEAEEKNSAEKVIPGEYDDKRAIGSSHNRNPKRFFCATKTLLCVVVPTFALIIVAKLLIIVDNSCEISPGY